MCVNQTNKSQYLKQHNKLCTKKNVLNFNLNKFHNLLFSLISKCISKHYKHIRFLICYKFKNIFLFDIYQNGFPIFSSIIFHGNKPILFQCQIDFMFIQYKTYVIQNLIFYSTVTHSLLLSIYYILHTIHIHLIYVPNRIH